MSLRAIGLVLLLTVTGCGGTTAQEQAESDRRIAEAMGSGDKYQQTWPKPYGETTCTEWLGTMTNAQHFAAAADMLTGARNKGDGGTGLPPDALISEFQQGVTKACVIPSMTVAEVGAVLYLTERSRFGL